MEDGSERPKSSQWEDSLLLGHGCVLVAASPTMLATCSRPKGTGAKGSPSSAADTATPNPPHPSTDIRKQRHIFQTSIFDSICSSERIHRKQAGLGMVTSRRAQDAKIIQQGKPIRIVTNQPKAFKQALAHENPLAQQGTGEIGG